MSFFACKTNTKKLWYTELELEWYKKSYICIYICKMQTFVLPTLKEKKKDWSITYFISSYL